MKDYLQFMILLEGIAVCAGYFNAAFLLRIDINWRYLFYTIVEGLNWVTFFSVYFFFSELSYFVQTNLVVSCCLVARISSAVGNCTNYGQLKSLPQELCKPYNVGLALARIVPIIYISLLMKANYNPNVFIVFVPMCLFTGLKQWSQNWFQLQI